MVVIDTNVAVLLRDGDTETIRRLKSLDGVVAISVITRIELEGGASPPSPAASERRARLSRLLEAVTTLSFDAADADAYRAILAVTGYSKRKILDRMVAAQATVRDTPLATLNPADFRDVPNLRLLAW